MTCLTPTEALPLVLSGDAEARGRGQAAAKQADPARVRAATVGRVEAARAEGVFDTQARDYLRAQRAFHEEHDPHGMAELGGIAEGFGLDPDELFMHLHLGTLRDLKDGGGMLEGDGCSAWGWLRYFLMTRILASCSSVEEALEIIWRVPHAGGGTLVLADASGAVAAAELGAAKPGVATGRVVCRTNHFVIPGLADDTLFPFGDLIVGNSQSRFDYLESQLPGRSWGIADAANLMRTHADSAPLAAPLCQHGETDGSETLSSSIYSCRLRTLTFSEGRPCAGRWLTYRIPS